MKSPMLLWYRLAVELGGELGIDTTRDLVTVTRRCKHEGDEFLTITLPTLRKALEQALSNGRWDAHTCTAFAVQGSLPRFLGGFFERVFDRDTGAILEAPDTDAIRYIRQLTGMFGSLLPDQGNDSQTVGCSEDRVKAAFLHYLETDVEVASHAASISETDITRFRKALDAVFGPSLRNLDSAVWNGSLRPRHSGGATADRLKGNQKWTFPEWTERLEEVFPYLENTVPSMSLASHRLNDDGAGLTAHFRSPEDELPVRVIAVPKTCEKPRIISIEPSYMQYMQQAVGRALMKEFSRPSIRQMIQLDHREHNQLAALMGSLDGSLATLDLKDASDRLSWRLVERGFESYPWLLKAMDATRTRKADVAGAEVHTLAKFASMGSALTFPVQTMVFATIAIMGIAETHGISPIVALSRFGSLVRVFGDDIIIPTDAVPSVIRHLETYGFKLNAAKSFWTGKFRESCGGEYYAGEDVGYVKVKRRFPSHKNDVEQIESAVALRNRLYQFGYWKTAGWLDELLVDLLRFYPAISDRSELLGRITFLKPEGLKMDSGLQIPITTGFIADRRIPSNLIEGVDALTRYFFEKEAEVDDDWSATLFAELPEADRFDRSGRPTRAMLKRRSRPF